MATRHQVLNLSARHCWPLKKQVQEVASLPVEVQHLTYQGKSMKDHRKLSHYKVRNDRTVLLIRLGVDLDPKPKPKPPPVPTINNNNNEVAMDSKDALSLPNESGRYTEHNSKDPAASTRPPNGVASEKFTDAASINSFLDNWFGGGPIPQQKDKHQQQQQEEQKQEEQQQPEQEEQQQEEEKQAEQEEDTQEENKEDTPVTGQQQTENKPPQPKYIPPTKKIAPVNPQGMSVFQSLLEDTPRAEEVTTTSHVTQHVVQSGDDHDLVKFVVKCGKKDVKLKMKTNQDLWQVKLKLEAAKVGRAGQMVLLDADGEELEEDGTLEENDITDGTKLLCKIG